MVLDGVSGHEQQELHLDDEVGEDEERMEATGPWKMKGVGVAPGIAIGPAYIHARDVYDDVERRDIDGDDVDSEVERFRRAVERSERELQKISELARDKLGEESASIFEAQMMMLHDDAVFENAADRIAQTHCNAEFAVQSVMNKHRRLMEASDSEYLRDRAHDLLDVQERIIRHLRRGKIISDIDPHTIVVAESLTAADIILFSRRNMLGCATDFGGATSHVAIMARALGVPAVVSLHGFSERVQGGDMLILDGLTGTAILDPDDETVARYRERQARYEQLRKEQKQIVPLPAETLDGHEVRLRANVELEEELSLLDEYGAEGIGLFRTEFLFFTQRRLSFSEDEQYETYRRVVEATGESGTTFRALDLGGDKVLPMSHREHNPMLGWRGLRVLLDRPDVLTSQLRALVRASAHGPVRLLLPMVTHIAEVRQFRETLAQVCEELRESGHTIADDVPVGVMVEVPAVALMAEQFASIVDFFSIGSNDLTQFTLALDRGNDMVAEKYDELHPAVLHLIQRTIQAARKHGIPVSLCGEMGANPRATPLLIGMGLTELSASPTFLPEIKRVIRAIRRNEAEELVQQALAAQDVAEVHALLDAWLDERECNPMHMLDA